MFQCSKCSLFRPDAGYLRHSDSQYSQKAFPRVHRSSNSKSFISQVQQQNVCEHRVYSVQFTSRSGVEMRLNIRRTRTRTVVRMLGPIMDIMPYTTHPLRWLLTFNGWMSEEGEMVVLEIPCRIVSAELGRFGLVSTP